MADKRYFRVRFKKMGGHYHCRVFSAPEYNATYAKLGDLVLDEGDWKHRHGLFHSGAEFLAEESTDALAAYQETQDGHALASSEEGGEQ